MNRTSHGNKPTTEAPEPAVVDIKPVEEALEPSAVKPVVEPAVNNVVLTTKPAAPAQTRAVLVVPPEPVVPAPVKAQAPRWRKRRGTGPHFLRDGSEVPENGVICAWPEEMVGLEDKFSRLDPAVDGEPTGPVPPPATLTVKHRGFGKYDVVDPAGKPLNMAPLTKEEATSLVNGQVKDDLPPQVEDD